MRRLVLLTTLALLGASAASAQDLLADANKDGKVTATEYQNSRRTFLMRADRNKDGKISADEWKKGADLARDRAREAGIDGWPAIGKADIFTSIDTDKDGFVTPAEIDTAMGLRFAKYDPNHDGVITRSEAREIERQVKAKP